MVPEYYVIRARMALRPLSVGCPYRAVKTATIPIVSPFWSRILPACGWTNQFREALPLPTLRTLRRPIQSHRVAFDEGAPSIELNQLQVALPLLWSRNPGRPTKSILALGFLVLKVALALGLSRQCVATLCGAQGLGAVSTAACIRGLGQEPTSDCESLGSNTIQTSPAALR